MNDRRNPNESNRPAPSPAALDTVIARLAMVEHASARKVDDVVDHVRELAKLASFTVECVQHMLRHAVATDISNRADRALERCAELERRLAVLELAELERPCVACHLGRDMCVCPGGAT